MRIPDSDSPMQTQRIFYIQIGRWAPARATRGDERTGGKLLLMDGELHAIGARLERCAHMEAPWRMQVDVRALAKARSSQRERVDRFRLQRTDNAPKPCIRVCSIERATVLSLSLSAFPSRHSPLG